MILNASAKPPFTKQAEHPTIFYNTIITETSAFKAKQLIDHEVSISGTKRFKVQDKVPSERNTHQLFLVCKHTMLIII